MKSLFIFFATIILVVSTNAQNLNNGLREELLKMREVDQKAREECIKGNGDEQIKCLAKISETIDQPNTKRLAEIFGQYGFPTAKMVGKEGVEAFLLLLQHGPDETLHRKCLKPVKKAFKRKEITSMEFAGYVDRLLIRQGKPQIYGSNFDFKGNKLVMSEVNDRKNLDKRRQKIGLPPIAEYARVLIEIYNLEVVIPPIN